MSINAYEMIWIFMIYAFIGWCVEVIYVGLNSGKFVNRGFLNGPYCPIYGFGVLIVLSLLTPLKDDLLALFIGSVVVTSALEFITGLILEKVFAKRWWDYSDVPFNLMGYVCLKFSIFWGLGCMFVVNIIHPYIYRLIQFVPVKLGAALLTLSIVWILLDLVATIDLAWDEKNNLRVLENSAKGMRKISDSLGEGVYKTASGVAERISNVKEGTEDGSADWIIRFVGFGTLCVCMIFIADFDPPYVIGMATAIVYLVSELLIGYIIPWLKKRKRSKKEKK